MALQLSSKKTAHKNDFCFSYSVKRERGRPSRVGFARVLDISESGLCMEISPYDSDLFVEWGGGQPGINKDIELQIFCRSHPRNVCVEGSVKWFKQKSELVNSPDKLYICAGVMFSIHGDEQKQQISELLQGLNNATTRCKKCNATVSVSAAFCYDCGAKLIHRRDILKETVTGLWGRNDSMDNA